jgi:hypothetical protein
VRSQLDDVPGLLAAEGPAALAQLLEHVAVADPGDGTSMPAVPHGLLEAVVGHDGDRDPVDLEMGGRERYQLVAVDDGAGAVDREHAVAVAVEGEAEVVASGDDAVER